MATRKQNRADAENLENPEENYKFPGIPPPRNPISGGGIPGQGLQNSGKTTNGDMAKYAHADFGVGIPGKPYKS